MKPIVMVICGVVLLLSQTGCAPERSSLPLTRMIQIQQTWQLQPGDAIANHSVVAGLGDISIRLNGDSVYAPFDGQVQQNVAGCILFSSPDVPAYLFRLCGLKQPKLGTVQQGETIGSGDYVHIATLRKQPEGTWAMVEPAKDILEKLLNRQ
ncbi:hypothetical protein [Leptolyngbya sp. FACHB-711]|uniref:hypothetical protein n=1 Tax=unclassified Leptolyngbya TaxID=2650499 RepID=UPI0016875F15|nr:hypothetical protein [Leptolyngbya sp. FACHB-711]MBD1848573.1 hypothetical protein [Cyanobacteria bacterium FACHB-502]MBD2026317.1 hypothetical protein [Leptolyngbya sp. FACHB-711]